MRCFNSILELSVILDCSDTTKRTYSEYTGDVFAAGVDDIRGQDRTDRKLFIPRWQE